MSNFLHKSPLRISLSDKMPRRFTYENEQSTEEEVYEDEYPADGYQEDDGYSSEERDNYDAEYGGWPQPVVARPHIPSLVKMYAPPIQKPEPLSAEILAAYEEYKKKSSELNTVHAANSAAAKKVAAELAALEEEAKGINKWSSRGTREAQKKRLETDLAAAEKKKEASKAAMDAHKADGAYLRDIISNHEKDEEIWEELEKEKRVIARMTREAMEAVERDMAEWRASRAVAAK